MMLWYILPVARQRWILSFFKIGFFRTQHVVSRDVDWMGVIVAEVSSI
jgi:hypothetical protein